MSRHLARLCCFLPLVAVLVGVSTAQAQLLDSLFDETPIFGPRAGVNYQTKENGGDRFTDIRLFAPFGIYNQIGFGWEAVVNGLEVRNNFYHPLGTDRVVFAEAVSTATTPGTDPYFEANFLKADVTNTIQHQHDSA